MYRIACWMVVICLGFMVGCSDASKYENEDVVAIVRGEEITIGDIRFMAEIDDEKIPDAVEARVKVTLVVQEAKEMGIDVSDEVNESVEFFGQYPSEDIDTDQANETREFAEAQAERFDMEPEEYHKEYVKMSAEISAYQNAFFEEHLEPFSQPETEEELEEMDEKIDEIVEELFQKYEDEIEIMI